MNRKKLTPENIKKIYERWGWSPGTLLQIKVDKYYFWVFDNSPAKVWPMQDENDSSQKTNEIILGDKNQAVFKDECILFLGHSPIAIATSEEEYTPECESYYVLKFLTNTTVVYLDIFPIIYGNIAVSEIFTVRKQGVENVHQKKSST